MDERGNWFVSVKFFSEWKKSGIEEGLGEEMAGELAKILLLANERGKGMRGKNGKLM